MGVECRIGWGYRERERERICFIRLCILIEIGDYLDNKKNVDENEDVV